MADDNDEGDDDYNDNADEIAALKQEIEDWKKKYKTMELKKRESDIALNKIKTEINSLRSVDRLWKESAKSVHSNLNSIKQVFDVQVDQVINGLSVVAKTGERISEKIPFVKKIREKILQYQSRIAKQEESIINLNGRIRVLEVDLADKKEKVERLSQGIEEEVERLTKPVRDKCADFMNLLMKEKAARAQERRDIADLWPEGHLLPTILMKYRALTPLERETRIKYTVEQNASLALSLEIRANVAESKSWETKYDDYGRAFFQHRKTGETSWDPPPIMKYKPPPGRDEMGNIIQNDDNEIANWNMLCNDRGEVYYQHKQNGTISYVSPTKYQKIPKGKSTLALVSDAAQIVLNHIKSRITKHIEQCKKRKYELENPLTFEQQKKKEKDERNKQALDPSTDTDNSDDDDDEDLPELPAYQYDIETIELLANVGNPSYMKSIMDKDPEVVRAEQRSFLIDNELRNFNPDFLSGPTVIETDVNGITIIELRKILENFASNEESLEIKLKRVRDNLKDFSLLLMERLVAEDKAKEEAIKLEMATREKERRAEEKRLLIEGKQKARMEQQQLTQNDDLSSSIQPDNNDNKEQILSNKENITSNKLISNDIGDQPVLSILSQPILEESNLLNKNDEMENSVVSSHNNENKNDDNDDNNSDADSELSLDSIVKEMDYGSILFSNPTLDPIMPDISPEMIELSTNLVNFAIFCGFTNVHVNESPYDGTYDYSLFADERSDLIKDDQWLSSSFFITISKDKLDKMRESTSKIYDAQLGLQNITPLRSAKLINKKKESEMLQFVEKENPATTSSILIVNQNLKSNYEIWKKKHLLSDVIRHQIQQEAIRTANDRRLISLTSESHHKLNYHNLKINNGLVYLRIKSLSLLRYEKYTGLTFNQYYIQVRLGGWIVRTSSKNNSPLALKWDKYNISEQDQKKDDMKHLYGLVSINDIHINNLIIEVLDDNPNNPEEYFVGSGQINIQSLLGYNTGRDMSFSVEIMNKSTDLQPSSAIGKVVIVANTDFNDNYDNDLLETTNNDNNIENNMINIIDNNIKVLPFNDNNKEQDNNSEIMSDRHDVYGSDERKDDNHTIGGFDITSMTNQPYSSIHPANQMTSFDKLVSDLRGDSANFIKALTGNITINDIQSKGFPIDNTITQKLPNFKNTSRFMKLKATRFNTELEMLTSDIDVLYQSIEELLQKKNDVTNRLYNDHKLKYRKIVDQYEDVKKEVLRVQKNVLEAKKPTPVPKEPALGELPPINYVPKMQIIGAIDSKGKKKKALPAAELKILVDKLEDGFCDGMPWPIPENYWPSQSQQLKLNKAMEIRNSVLDGKREQEINMRNKQIELYRNEVAKYEVLERRRLAELQKAKKESRKANLRHECVIERLSRAEKECSYVEDNLLIIKTLKMFHEKSKSNYKILSFKSYMEMNRQKTFINNTKLKLLKLIKTRSIALELPLSAKNEVEFAKLIQDSDELLNIAKMEIFECKQSLIEEGQRLRTTYHERISMAQNEYNRLLISKEILFQRESVDNILERYKYEIGNLYLDLEKLKVAESENDDDGIETINDEGEIYKTDKKWGLISPQILKCIRLIELVMNKILLTEKTNSSINQSQLKCLDVILTYNNNNMLCVRDNWIENSDYERSTQLLYDTLQYLAIEKHKLISIDKNKKNETINLNKQLILYETTNQQNLINSNEETLNIMIYTNNIINAIRLRADQENSITQLSRECQNIREELLQQEMKNNEKLKILFAFIDTLQTTVSQLSIHMEIIMDEREKIVIQSKLLADKMRHQLRIERKHNCNLSLIIHGQKGYMKYLLDIIQKLTEIQKKTEFMQQTEKAKLRKDIYEQMFCFSRLCVDVDALFEFFAARLANLAGARESINNSLAGEMGWNGYIETRILLWDSVLYWKMYKSKVLATEQDLFLAGLEMFHEKPGYEALLHQNENIADMDDVGTMNGSLETSSFAQTKSSFSQQLQKRKKSSMSGTVSLRTLIKQRRQWALRAIRRYEGPNVMNQKLLNIKDGVIPALLEMCLKDASDDWEIARNASLAISIASYEISNHHDMVHNQLCVNLIIKMCCKEDAEVQTHAAVTIANLCHQDEYAQSVFGESNAIKVLLELCDKVPVVDVLEASTAALANLSCYHDRNCHQIITSNGVKIILQMMKSCYSENLLDLDQNDEIQANAAELLANVSRFYTEETASYFDSEVINSLVLLCSNSFNNAEINPTQGQDQLQLINGQARPNNNNNNAIVANMQLKRHVPLVLGNIAQSEHCREMIGLSGGIEALFLVLETNDSIVQSNVLWSLCNLMWHPPNQERAGRFMQEIVLFLNNPVLSVRIYANSLLANVLFYNTNNRIRFLEIDNSMEMLLDFIIYREDSVVVENALRSILSLSYLDSIAMWLGVDGGHIPLFLSFLFTPYYSRDSMKYSLEIICNLCLHHVNRRIIYESKGIEAIVGLHIDQDVYIRELSVKVIGYLEDITPPEVLARMKVEIGLERMVSMASNSNPLVRAVAAESIGEFVWKDANKQKRVQETGGVDALLAIIKNPEEEIESLLPGLWSLRNLMHENHDIQSQFCYRDGPNLVTDVIKRCFLGQYMEQSEKIFESCLSCLYNSIINHEKNSRKLLLGGLDTILDLSDSKITCINNKDISQNNIDYIYKAMKSEGIIALAKSILLMLGPYNYVVCRNCQKKQDLHGTSCYNCGYRLFVDVDGILPSSGTNITNDLKKKQSKKMMLSSTSQDILFRGGNRLSPLQTSADVNDHSAHAVKGYHNKNNILSQTAPAKLDGLFSRSSLSTKFN
eukprot:gene8951-12071_t